MSRVYFIPHRTEKSLLTRIVDVFERAGYQKIFQRDDIVAIKLHMGELGNTAFVRPIYVRKIYEWLKSLGTNPFLTDTTTLYRGSRGTAVDYLNTALWNGFGFAPIIIADGLAGGNGIDVEISGNHYEKVRIAEAIVNADKLVVITHFKGHEQTGFGGAIKNLGMGCAVKEGKLSMHSMAIPRIKEEKCTGCEKCRLVCPADAIKIIDKLAVIEKEKCIGCGECIGFCPFGAIKVVWDAPIRALTEKMVEHALGAVKDKEAIYINFLLDIAPECDCYPRSRGSIVPDIGILISRDPVAIDQASIDLVTEVSGNPLFGVDLPEGAEKFSIIHQGLNPEYQLEYAEKTGLGERKYELKKVGK